MARAETIWIWQQPEWARFHWQSGPVDPLLRSVRLQLGALIGKAGVLPDGESDQTAALDTLLQNIITSSAIEGETLDADSVRSSLANRLHLATPPGVATTARSEGLADLLLDATLNVRAPMTIERLFQWHGWLFPKAGQVLHDLRVGALRGDDPMRVVSGRIDRPRVHFEAPPGERLESELGTFLNWFNSGVTDDSQDPILRAGLCHLWFVTIHPFEDGNGRIARALTDLALAQADAVSIRLYTMSSSILQRRASYYSALESTQRGGLDITQWLVWFLDTLGSSISSAERRIEQTLIKTRFWRRHHDAGLSQPQIKVLNRLLDGGERGFEQGISASQYQKVAKVSKATATRHLADLLEKGCIDKLPGGGRSTRYQVRLD